MKSFHALILLFILSVTTLTAESEYTPPLGMAFPLTKTGENITVPYPILINTTTIIQPGTILRTIYVPPTSDDAEVNRRSTEEKIEPTFTKQPLKKVKPLETNTPLEKVAYKRAMKTVWTDQEHFRAALERYYNQEPRLVYQSPETQDIKLQYLNFPEGLFLCSEDGKIIVLSVQHDSSADKASIVPNSILTAINDIPLNGSLQAFTDQYNSIKQGATSSNRNITLTVIAPNSTTPQNITLKVPLSLSTDIWSQQL